MWEAAYPYTFLSAQLVWKQINKFFFKSKWKETLTSTYRPVWDDMQEKNESHEC